jgi:hypothetical protein
MAECLKNEEVFYVGKKLAGTYGTAGTDGADFKNGFLYGAVWSGLKLKRCCFRLYRAAF